MREIFIQFKKIVTNLQVEIEEKFKQMYDLKERPPSEKKSSRKDESAKKEENGIGDINEGDGFGIGFAEPSEQYTKKKKGEKSRKGTPKTPEIVVDPPKEEEKPLTPEKKPVLDKNKAYEEFKETEGAEEYKALKENLVNSRSKKEQLKKLSIQLNEAKREIDMIKEKIEFKNQEKAQCNIFFPELIIFRS